MSTTWEIIYRAVLAAILALAVALSVASVVSCATAPKATPVPAAAAPATTDEAAIKHRVEMDEELVYAAHIRAQVMGWAYVIGGLLIAVGILLAMLVSGLRARGVALMLVGVLLWGFASAVNDYGRTVALIGVVGLSAALLVALALLGWAVWTGHFWRTAAEDQVKVAEKAKAVLPPEKKQLIWGADGIAAHSYAPSTKRLVERIRSKLSNEKGNSHAGNSPPG